MGHEDTIYKRLVKIAQTRHRSFALVRSFQDAARTQFPMRRRQAKEKMSRYWIAITTGPGTSGLIQGREDEQAPASIIRIYSISLCLLAHITGGIFSVGFVPGRNDK